MGPWDCTGATLSNIPDFQILLNLYSQPSGSVHFTVIFVPSYDNRTFSFTIGLVTGFALEFVDVNHLHNMQVQNLNFFLDFSDVSNTFNAFPTTIAFLHISFYFPWFLQTRWVTYCILKCLKSSSCVHHDVKIITCRKYVSSITVRASY
jgi:hypothetical protein